MLINGIRIYVKYLCMNTKNNICKSSITKGSNAGMFQDMFYCLYAYKHQLYQWKYGMIKSIDSLMQRVDLVIDCMNMNCGCIILYNDCINIDSDCMKTVTGCINSLTENKAGFNTCSNCLTILTISMITRNIPIHEMLVCKFINTDRMNVWNECVKRRDICM